MNDYKIGSDFLGDWRGCVEKGTDRAKDYRCALRLTEEGGSSTYIVGANTYEGVLLPTFDPNVLSERRKNAPDKWLEEGRVYLSRDQDKLKVQWEKGYCQSTMDRFE